MRGSRRTGSPTTSTSGTSSGTRARIRSTSARSRAASRAASARTARSEAAAATIAGMFSNPGARPDSRSSAGPWGANRVPLRTTSSPTPGGPPHLWALAVSSDQSPSTGPQPSDCAASTSSGTPAARHTCGHLGHRLLRAHLVVGGLEAGQRGVRAAAPRANAAGVDTRPVRSTGDLRHRAAGRLVDLRRCSTEECSTADTIRWRPVRRRPASAPGDAGVHGPGPRRGEDQFVRAAAHRLRRGLAGGVEQQPGPPPLAVQPGRVGPPLVERGRQGLTGDGMQRSGGSRVEVGHADHASPSPRRGRQKASGAGHSRWSRGPRRAERHPFGESRRRVGHPPRATPNSVQ